MRPVFESSFNGRHCPLVVVYGQPGTGKSFLADHVLSRLENEFKANEGEGNAGAVVEEYSCKIQARGRDAVRDGLHKMGLTLYDKVGVGASASVDDVLGSDSKPQRLRNFLLKKRFVIVADDSDAEGCNLHIGLNSGQWPGIPWTSNASTTLTVNARYGCGNTLDH